MKSILLLLSLAFTVSAQESKRTCRILFPGGPQQQPGKYYLYDGLSCQEVSLPRLSFSPVYKLSSGDIRLWLLDSPVSKPEEIPTSSPVVTVGAANTDIYLIIIPDPGNSRLPLEMKPVNANFNQIALGEMLWINLTQKQLAGKIGKSSLSLPANSSAVVKKPATDAGDYAVEVYFRVPDDERTHPLLESQWYHDPRARNMVFVFDDGKRRAPKVMSFSDFRMPEKKEDE